MIVYRKSQIENNNIIDIALFSPGLNYRLGTDFIYLFFHNIRLFRLFCPQGWWGTACRSANHWPTRATFAVRTAITRRRTWPSAIRTGPRWTWTCTWSRVRAPPDWTASAGWRAAGWKGSGIRCCAKITPTWTRSTTCDDPHGNLLSQYDNTISDHSAS